MCPMILGEEGGLVNVSDYLLVLAHLGCSGKRSVRWLALLLIYFVIAQALYYAFVLNYYRSWTRR